MSQRRNAIWPSTAAALLMVTLPACDNGALRTAAPSTPQLAQATTVAATPTSAFRPVLDQITLSLTTVKKSC
ncbi:hypothetical protein [Nocardia cyriacigeorgica]|uniref:hypothetical protein n=1 Tax=Nocardia cyriacigeorgica TaxID=135487 RepID=UPI002458A960|nr:hypothetical protein [Nocardia cyriacigeorgica]